MSTGKMPIDTRARNRSPRPIRHCQDDGHTDNCDFRPREFQIMLRNIPWVIHAKRTWSSFFTSCRHPVAGASTKLRQIAQNSVSVDVSSAMVVIKKSSKSTLKGLCDLCQKGGFFLLRSNWVGRLLSQSITHPSKPNLATLLASSSAVVHVGPGQSSVGMVCPLHPSH